MQHAAAVAPWQGAGAIPLVSSLHMSCVQTLKERHCRGWSSARVGRGESGGICREAQLVEHGGWALWERQGEGEGGWLRWLNMQTYSCHHSAVTMKQ